MDVNSFNENKLQTMFHGNYITGGVFDINLAPAKNEVKSSEVDPKRKKRRLIIESDSSQCKNPQHDAILRYAFAVIEFFSSLLEL